MAAQVTVSKADIVGGLRRLGVGAGDVLMVHSSLSSLGWVEGGAETVIAALMESLGEDGTLLMPSFGAQAERGTQYDRVRSNGVVFDVRNSPSLVGRITDVFWRLPGVRRSLNPTHSVAGWGRRRDEFLSGHERCRWSCGVGSPFHKLIGAGGRVLLVGVGHESNTFLHTIEDTGPTPSTSRILFEPKLIDYDGRVLTVPTFPHLPGLSRNFGAADAFCRQRGLQRDGTIGAAAVRLVDARGFYLAAQEALAADPLFFIDRDHYRGRSAAAEQPGA